MPRSINESIQTLQTSLSYIKTSLTNKNVEGGEQIKVSEVAGLIDQIEAGSAEKDFTYIKDLKAYGQRDLKWENPYLCSSSYNFDIITSNIFGGLLYG